MAKERKKIALIFATGTVMTAGKKRTILYVDSPEDQKNWLDEMPELSIIADVQPYFLVGESETVGHQTVVKLADSLDQLWGEYDGFVVLVRTDSLAFTSVLTQYLLQGFGKPVIFSGSSISPKAIEQGKLGELYKKFSTFGLKSNVINAVQLATREIVPISIMYGNRLLNPAKALRTSLDSVNAFESADGEYLAKVDFSIRLNIDKKKQSVKYKKADKIESRISFISSDLLTDDIISSYSGKVLIIEIKENEQLDESLRIKLAELSQPVIIYNYWFVLDHADLINISHMTKDTLKAKVLWVAGQALDKNEFATIMRQNVIDEFVL